MDWVIAGPYPPTADPAAMRTLAFARDRLHSGDDVLVLSPVPAAAHRTAHLGGLRGITTLHRACREADGLYLTLQRGIGPTPAARRAKAFVERALLARVLRSVPRSVVDVSDASLMIGGRAGRLVLEAANEFVVKDAETRDHLVSLGAASTKLHVVRNGEHRSWTRRDISLGGLSTGVPVDTPPLVIPPEANRTTIERMIRQRAALAARSALPPFTRVDGTALVRALPPLVLPTPPNTIKGRVARVVSRLTSWQLGPVVERVNLLQRTVAEAMDPPVGRGWNPAESDDV